MQLQQQNRTVYHRIPEVIRWVSNEGRMNQRQPKGPSTSDRHPTPLLHVEEHAYTYPTFTLHLCPWSWIYSRRPFLSLSDHVNCFLGQDSTTYTKSPIAPFACYHDFCPCFDLRHGWLSYTDVYIMHSVGAYIVQHVHLNFKPSLILLPATYIQRSLTKSLLLWEN